MIRKNRPSGHGNKAPSAQTAHPSGAVRKLVPCKDKSVEMGSQPAAFSEKMACAGCLHCLHGQESSLTLRDTERCNIASISRHANGSQCDTGADLTLIFKAECDLI